MTLISKFSCDMYNRIPKKKFLLLLKIKSENSFNKSCKKSLQFVYIICIYCLVQLYLLGQWIVFCTSLSLSLSLSIKQKNNCSSILYSVKFKQVHLIIDYFSIHIQSISKIKFKKKWRLRKYFFNTLLIFSLFWWIFNF